MTLKTAFDTMIVDDFHLHEQLIALRHLRPGTRLPHPQGPLARQLRDELLQLSDERDPLLWLQQERGLVTALLMLSLALDLASHLYLSMQQMLHLSSEPGTILQREQITEYEAQQATLFGRLLTFAGDYPPPAVSLERITGISDSGHLLTELARLRQQSALPTEFSPSRSSDEPGITLLLSDLLRLPGTRDPLQWLQEERGDLSAREVLAYLVRQSCPPPDFLQDAPQVRSSVHPETHLRIRSNLSVHIERIDFYEQGFAIYLRARLRDPEATGKRPPHAPPFFPNQWKGFDRIVDNHGWYYLSQSEVHPFLRLWWWQERIILRCYPSVGDAQELFVQSQPAALAAYRIPLLGNELVPIPGPILGEMHASIPLH